MLPRCACDFTCTDVIQVQLQLGEVEQLNLRLVIEIREYLPHFHPRIA